MYSEADMTRLVEAMRRTGTTLLEVEGAGDFLRLVLPETEAVPSAVSAVPDKPTPRQVKSPWLGRFAARGGDDGLPRPPAVGDAVRAGEVLGYVVEEGARVPVCAPVSGSMAAVQVQDGQIVGYGDVLFELEQQA